MYFYTLILFVLNVLTSSACPDGFEAHIDSCYAILPVKASWAEAKTYCSVIGAELAVIRSKSESDFIHGYLLREHGIGFEVLARHVCPLDDCNEDTILLQSRLRLTHHAGLPTADCIMNGQMSTGLTRVNTCWSTNGGHYGKGYTYTISTSQIWIGGTDLVQEGVWRTPDNSEILPYLNWAPSEPDNLGGQHCLAIFNAGGLQWDDNTCEVHNFALCKQSNFNGENIIG